MEVGIFTTEATAGMYICYMEGAQELREEEAQLLSMNKLLKNQHLIVDCINHVDIIRREQIWAMG